MMICTTKEIYLFVEWKDEDQHSVVRERSVQEKNLETLTRGDIVEVKHGGVPYAAIVVGVGR